MTPIGEPTVGLFCWLDLAASDAAEAKAFYRGLFGWTAIEQHSNGGIFTRLCSLDRDVGSLYQMGAKFARKVPSHWTPYVRVEDVELAARRASELGGQVLVRPFVVSGVARIALIMDSVGAQVGLWEPIDSMESERHG
jgi:predicted enzyme related to lactoylglutathione lyase